MTRPIVLLLAVVFAATGCTTKSPKLGAAEPAVAPTSTVSAQGTVVAVGAAPEGIVYDPITGLVAVTVRSPNRLILLDGKTLRIVGSIPLAGHARHLQLAKPGGPVIVPEEDANRVALVSLPTGAVTEFKTGNSPHDATAVSGGYVAGDEFGGSLTIDRVGGSEQTETGLVQPGGVIGVGGEFAVVDVGNFTVSTYRVSDGVRLAQLSAGKGPTHIVRAADGQLVVADTRGNKLIRYSENPLRRLGTSSVSGAPYGLATDPTTPRVWVSLTARNQLVGFDVTATGLKEFARLDTVSQPDTVAVEPGSRVLFVAGNRAGVVQRLER